MHEWSGHTFSVQGMSITLASHIAVGVLTGMLNSTQSLDARFCTCIALERLAPVHDLISNVALLAFPLCTDTILC